MSKIYIVINDISKIGGLSSVALQLYRLWSSYGFEVKIISGHFESSERVKEVEKDVINLGLGSVHKLHGRFAKALWYGRFLYRLRKVPLEKDAIVVGIETIINILSYMAFREKAYKIIATEHLSFERSTITQWMKRKVYPLLTLVVLTNEDAKRYRKFCSDVRVIPNFVEIPNRVSGLDKKNILFVGKLEPIKGIDYLVKIIQKFSLEDWKFTIVGIGDGSLKKWAQERLKGYNVVFKGELQRVDEEYLSASILVLTSRKEGFPMVLLEAKSYGLPIVSFDTPTGPKEIVRDGKDGFLVPFGDVDGFVERLELLASNKEMRETFSKEARKDIERFSPQRIGKLWLQLLS